MKRRDQQLESFVKAISAIVGLVNRQSRAIEFPTHEYSVFWLSPNSEGGGARGVTEDREEPAYHLLRFANPDIFESIEVDPDVVDYLDKCGNYVEQFGRQLPALRLDGSALCHQALSVYFNRLGHFGLDESYAKQVWDEFALEIESETAVISSEYLVNNFDAESEFELTDEIRFRRITEADIDRYGRIGEFGHSTLSAHSNRPWLNKNNWICEMESTTPKNTMEIVNSRHEAFEGIRDSLALAVDGSASFLLLGQQFKSPYTSMWTMSSINPIFTSRNGTATEMTSTDVARYREIYASISRLNDDESLAYLKFPLRRFRLSATRTEVEDRVVDYVIGLERLLTADSPNLETTFRFRLRGAALLAGDFGNARERLDLMSKIYGLRSDIVHGRAEVAELNEMVGQVEKVSKEVLCWYLRHATEIVDPRDVVRRMDECYVDSSSIWAADPK